MPACYGLGPILAPHFCRGSGTCKFLKWDTLQITEAGKDLFKPKGGGMLFGGILGL